MKSEVKLAILREMCVRVETRLRESREELLVLEKDMDDEKRIFRILKQDHTFIVRLIREVEKGVKK